MEPEELIRKNLLTTTSFIRIPRNFSYGFDVSIGNDEVDLPERYIINKNATILFWKDKTKTIIKRCEDDEFNPRLAFLTAFFQKYCGMSKNKANKYLANLQVEEEKTGETKKPKHMKEEE